MNPLLSPTQYDLLKADAESPTNAAALGAFLAAIDDQSIAAWYNEAAPVNGEGWRTSLTKAAIVGELSPEATVWSWTAYINRSAAERDAWREMFTSGGFSGQGGAINPSLENIRQGMQDIFSGAGGAGQRTHLLAMARRPMSRVERLFAVGVGTTVSPATMATEGPLTYLEVARALRNVGA